MIVFDMEIIALFFIPHTQNMNSICFIETEQKYNRSKQRVSCLRVLNHMINIINSNLDEIPTILQLINYLSWSCFKSN